MSSDKTSRKQARVLLFAAVLVLSVVTVGAFTAAAQFSATEELNTDNTELVEGSSVDLSPDTQTVVSDELEQRDGTAVALLIVERDIADSAFDTDQVDAATLQADSEATLGPVADTASSMEGVTVRNEFWVGNIVSVSVDLGAVDPADLAAIDGVIGVAPNAEMTHPSPVEETSDVSIDQDHNFTYGLQQIDVPGFEEKYNVSGEGATVSIIDDGISSPDDPHPDLDFAIKAVAEGGNVTTGTLGTAGSHGEHTAGTATGAADPVGDVPRYGVAPNASLIKINTFEGQAAAEDTLASVEFSVEQGADVASMSLGFPAQSGNSVLELLMEQQMQDALAAGTVVVGSAGNAGSGAAGGPATSPGAEFSGFSIGASNEARGIAGFSSGAIIDRFSVDYVDVGGGTQFPDYYPRQYVKPDVSAPGVGVLSSGPLGGDIGDPAATYSFSSGTSMAAPHVAGAVALIQSATAEDLPAPLIKSALAETAEKPDNDFPSLNSRDIRYGTGIINVTAATEAIVNGNLTIEGEVTDSEGNPVVGATVESEDGALTNTDENGSYTLQTTSESVNVTANAFGFAPETKLVEDDTSPVDFQLADEVAVDLRDGQPAFVEFGGGFDVTVEVANLENLTLALTSESDVAPGDVTVTLGGDELPLGEPIPFNGTVDGVVTLTVNLSSGGSYAEGDLLGIQHTFEGAGDSLVVETGPTELTETLDPAEYEVSNLSAPDNVVAGDAIPVSFEITNVGQQMPDSYGYQFFATDGETPISLPATELNIAPGETQTVSLSVAGVESFYGPGDVFTHGARVGVISPPTIDPVEDNVTAEAALQAPGSQFNVASLDAPLGADPGQSIDVTATIESVGELGDNQSVEFRFNGTTIASQTADLDAFTLAGGLDSTTVTFQNVTLPDQTGTFTHGVFTDNDSQTAEILVGDFTTVTVVEFGSTFGEGVQSLLAGNLPDNFNTQIVNGDDVTDSVVATTDIFVFNDLNVTAGSASDDLRQRTDSPFASSSGVTGNGLNADTAELITTVEADITTGAVYLDQWGGDSDAIVDRSSAIGDPAATDQRFDSNPAEYVIEQDSPLFDGVGSPGDVVQIHTAGFGDISWFSGASGETLATVQNSAGPGGAAAAVDPDSGSVLLSSLGVTSFVGPAEYTADAAQILANGVEVAQPPEFSGDFFDVTGLTAPAQADTGATINVSATVTNVGNETGTQTVEFVFDGSVAASTTVELDPGNETVVEFTDVPLPSEGGVFEHGVQTANDSQFAEITVGSPDIELVELDQPDELTPGEDIITEITITNNGTAPYEGEVLHATNLNDTAPDSGTIAVPANVTAFTLEPGENVTFTDNLGTFTEINGALDTNFGPGDEVETGYQRGQNLAAAFEGGEATIEEIYSETITIVEEAFLEVSDLAAPGEAPAGSSINVSATVTNTGGVAATQTVEFQFGGQTVANTTVDLDANASTTVEFSPTLPGQTGNFTHGVFTEDDNQTAEIAVVAPGPPNVTMADLSIAGQGEDATVVAGSYDVTAEMSHTGGASGDVPMELTIGNETLTKNVTLEADQTVTVTFENATSGLEPGIYDVSMAGSTDAVSGSLTLSVDVGGSQEPATDTTGDGNLDDITGDGEFNIFDVQALFISFEEPVIQDNAELFNFAGSDEVGIFDVQALFVDLVDS